MFRNKKAWLRCTVMAAGMTLLAAPGCSSRPNKREEANKPSKVADQNPSGEPQVIGAEYCIRTMMGTAPGPATPVHFSYKVNESEGPTSKDFEADLAGDALDQTIARRYPVNDFVREHNQMKQLEPIPVRDGFAEEVNKNHYKRGDASAWNMAGGTMSQAGTPWSWFILKPTFTRAGAETVAGYPTIKYTVDTTHQDQTDKLAGMLGMGLKDYNITGSVWVTRDTGCILQWVVDVEEDAKDGKISKNHYEGSVRK